MYTWFFFIWIPTLVLDFGFKYNIQILPTPLFYFICTHTKNPNNEKINDVSGDDGSHTSPPLTNNTNNKNTKLTKTDDDRNKHTQKAEKLTNQ